MTWFEASLGLSDIFYEGIVCENRKDNILQMQSVDSFEKDPVIQRSNQNSNFRAIKKLVQAEKSIRVAHNRIKVIQLNESKSCNKMQSQMNLIEKIQQAREFSNEHNSCVEHIKQQMQHETELAHSKYQQLTAEQKKKIREAYKELQKGRKWQYLTVQEKSQEAEKQINEWKKKEQSEKEQHRNKIVAEEEAVKQKLLKFYHKKQKKLKEAKAVELSLIRAKQANKSQQLRELSNLEMELLQRQSQSQASYLQIKSKLDSMLNTVKKQHNQSKKSLQASIHFQARESQRWS